MSTLKVSLFGRFCVEANGCLIHRLESRRAEELLNYLLFYKDRPHSRDHLADVLWGEIAPEQSKGYLRKALWQLHTFLELHKIQDMLLVEGEWLQVNPDFDLWLDIEVFEDVFKQTQEIRGRELEERQTQMIQRIIEIYRGDLLEGWYQDWCLMERERLQYHYLAMLDKLMDYCETHQQYEMGLLYGEKITRYDRARERTHRRLMRLHYLAGDRTAAIRQYQKCVQALHEELDVQPAERTRILYTMIQTDKFERLTIPEQGGASSTNLGKEPLSVVFKHFNTFQKALTQLQAQLDQDIEAIHKAIKGNWY